MTSETNTNNSFLRKHLVLIGCLLFTFLVLSPTLENGWVDWDDPAYVLDNPLVHDLSVSGIANQFTTESYLGNYQPLTLLVYSIQYNLAGPEASSYHWLNLLIHLINVGLVYGLIFMLCGRVGVAAITALLFGIHPMHLESVAWISSLKDVLYVFFFLLALLSYEYGKAKPGGHWKYYALALFLFLLSILSKGMAVVFPVLLLLMDFLQKREFTRKLWLEKVPFFAMSLFFGIVAIGAQAETNAITGLNDFPWYEAPLFAAYGLLIYLVKAIVPFQLAAYHPYPMEVAHEIPVYIFSLILLITFGFFVWKKAGKNRNILFGILFFGAAIGPVLQIVSVGNVLLAERYTYLAYIGLFYVMATLLLDWEQRQDGKKALGVKLLLLAYILTLGTITYNRGAVWKSDEQLWSDVIEAYPEGHFAYYKRASHRAIQGQTDLALQDYNSSLVLYPNFKDALNDRGMIYMNRGQWEQAATDFSKTIAIDSTYFKGYLNRGLVYMNTGNFNASLPDFNKSLQLRPDFTLGYINRGTLLEKMGYRVEAESDYTKAIELETNNPTVYKYRGVARYNQGRFSGALQDFTNAVLLEPNYAAAYYWRAKTHLSLGQVQQARQDAQLAGQLGFSLPPELLKALEATVR